MLLLCSLRGSIIVFQGEELGLPQVDVPFDQLQDPEAIANWPHTLSRDGARTPMPWECGERNAGFSTAEPWLPVGDKHAALAVDQQKSSRDSTLNFTKSCLGLRKRRPALRHGAMRIREAGERLLVFDREEDGEHLRCSFNLSAVPVERPASVGEQLIAVGEVSGTTLGAWSAVIEKLA
jgi:alpha-glucosidase